MVLPIYKMKMIYGKKISLIAVFLVLCFAAIGMGYEYDANDFATTDVNYVKGTGGGLDYIDLTPFDNPNKALGRPTVDTTGDGWNMPVSAIVPVVGVYSAFRSFELVSVGRGGQLILKFSHPVSDDKNNPYGIDFIIFGNTSQSTGGQVWKNGDPAFLIQSSVLVQPEPAVVSVSQDGNNWYRYSNGPFADSFAPTFGRIYDPNHPDANIGSWNHWWGQPTNPTVPLDPNLTPASFLNKSVAYMSQFYGQSAGGTGFDLAQSGMEWIQYVRIDVNNNPNMPVPEIDSVADVAACGDYKHPFPDGDINEDCMVDFVDFAILAQDWLAGTGWDDLATLAGNWLYCNWECE